MPRVAVRRKAYEKPDNIHGIQDGIPSKKIRRLVFEMPLPTRPTVVGKALVCGQGDMGQLGLGDAETQLERKRPQLINHINNVVDVQAGGIHSVILDNAGRIYTCGCNDEGALGREDGSEFEPTAIELPGKVVRISAGDSHSAGLLEDGRVFAWGSFRDSHGNMGLTPEGNQRLPVDVLPGVTSCDIASGSDHLVILTCGGKVYTVGCGEQGQLGRVSLRSASGEGRRGKKELLRPGEVIVKRAKPIENIWATNFGTFLRENETGNIYAFGLNNYKQLAYGNNQVTIINPKKTEFVNVKQIAGGQHHTLVLKEDGSCFVIGRHDYGRLGLGQLSKDVEELQPIQILTDKRVVSVSCGEAQSFAITDDGKLYSWGMGSNLQLGTGTEDDVHQPALIVSRQTQGKRIIRASSGGQHSIFLVEDEIQPTTAQQKPVLTKKAAAAGAAKERETKKGMNSENVQEVLINGKAELPLVEVKAFTKRGRKKK